MSEHPNIVDRLAAWRGNLPPRGPTDPPDGLSYRITRLEDAARASDARMSRIEDKLDTAIERLGRLPSRLDMLGYLIASTAAFLALTAVIVTAMGWLETRAARLPQLAGASQPIVIQLPSDSAVRSVAAPAPKARAAP